MIARTRTDANGQYSFSNVACPLVEKTTRRDPSVIAIMMAADSGGRMNWVDIPQPDSSAQPIKQTIDIVLEPSTSISGVILDSKDKPVSNVPIGLRAMIEFGDQAVHRGIFFCSDVQLETTSDAQGHFEFPHVPRGLNAHLLMSHPDYFPTVGEVRTSPTSKLPPKNFVTPAIEPMQSSPVRLHLDDEVMLHGKVVDRHGEILPGAIVGTNSMGRAKSISDEQGNFSVTISSHWLGTQSANVMVSPISLDWPSGEPYVASRPSVRRQEVVDGADLRLVAEDAITVKGQVLAADDLDPVPFLPLKLQALRRHHGYREFAIETDEQGFFSATLSQGRWMITCGPNPGFDLPPPQRAENYANDIKAQIMLRNPNIRLSQHAEKNANDINSACQRVIDLVAREENGVLHILIDRKQSSPSP